MTVPPGAAACLLLAALGAQPAPPSPPANDDVEVLEAVYRFLFRAVGWSGARYYCIAHGARERPEDPAPDLVRRFADHRPPVVPASTCGAGPANDARLDEGGPVETFLIEPVHWLDERTAETRARFHVHDRYAGAFACTITRTRDGWTPDCYLVEMS